MSQEKKIVYRPIPEAYHAPSEHPGTIERVEYRCEGKPKHAYVYVPYGYDSGAKYEILYLMHGGGDRADHYLGTDDTPGPFKLALDHMIEKGEVKPLLVVAPSFYHMDDREMTIPHAGLMTSIFHQELVEDLIPAVESAYSTYAEQTDKAGLKASREHRAFGGFSMGSGTTWWQFIFNLDYIATFLPFSGDCWIMGEKAGATHPKETAQYLEHAVKRAGYDKNGFRIFAATGTKDIAYTPLSTQVEAMKQLTDTFVYSDQADQGNFHFLLAEGKEHVWEAIWDYTYDILCLAYPNK